jgi:hypothetical protein
MSALGDSHAHLARMHQLHDAFLQILPRIELHGHIVFRGLKCLDRKQDLIAEMVALAWVWFLRLMEKGKDPTQFPSVLAAYAARAVKAGRRVCGQEKCKDVMSPRAQQRYRFRVEGLPSSTQTCHEQCHSCPHGQALQDAVEARLRHNTMTPPDEQAMFRIDFACWLASLTPRERHLIAAMARNERTTDLGRMFELSAGRISQLRREFHHGWLRFTGEVDEVDGGRIA